MKINLRDDLGQKYFFHIKFNRITQVPSKSRAKVRSIMVKGVKVANLTQLEELFSNSQLVHCGPWKKFR